LLLLLLLPLTPGVSTATQQARDNLQQQLNEQMSTTSVISMVTIANPANKQTTVTLVTPGQVTTPTNTANNTEQKKLEPTGGVETNQTQSQNQARKGLSLTVCL